MWCEHCGEVKKSYPKDGTSWCKMCMEAEGWPIPTSLDVHFSSGKDDWETPADLFQSYNRDYNFILDAAANQENHKCARWFGPGGEKEDALSVKWPLDEGNIWLNPPYGKIQKKFVYKVLEQIWLPKNYGKGNVVVLLPARTDTKLFHEVIRPHGKEIEFLKGRVKFVGAKAGAPFPSMIVIF